MVFPTRYNFPGQGTHFEVHKPFALGLANQQVYGYGPDGQGDKVVDVINDKLSGVCKDQSFDHRQWAKNSPVYLPTHLPTPVGPVPVGPVPVRPVPVGPATSYTVQIVTILAVAVVAGILAYVRPDLFASLFKLFIGYELFVFVVGISLALIVLFFFLKTKPASLQPSS